MARNLRKFKKGLSLIEVILSMVIISIALTGVFSTFLYLNKKGYEPFIDYEVNTLAQAISRDIARLENVTPSADCSIPDAPTAPPLTVTFTDVCHWEKLVRYYVTPDDPNSYFVLGAPYFNEQYSLVNSSNRDILANRGYQVKTTRAQTNFDTEYNSADDCPGSATSCVMKEFTVEVSHPLSDNPFIFTVNREVDAVGSLSLIALSVRNNFFTQFNNRAEDNANADETINTGLPTWNGSDASWIGNADSQTIEWRTGGGITNILVDILNPLTVTRCLNFLKALGSVQPEELFGTNNGGPGSTGVRWVAEVLQDSVPNDIGCRYRYSDTSPSTSTLGFDYDNVNGVVNPVSSTLPSV